jgi:hypothetical protein
MKLPTQSALLLCCRGFAASRKTTIIKVSLAAGLLGLFCRKAYGMAFCATNPKDTAVGAERSFTPR